MTDTWLSEYKQDAIGLQSRARMDFLQTFARACLICLNELAAVLASWSSNSIPLRRYLTGTKPMRILGGTPSYEIL